jgi:hypothetical protein
MRDISVLHRSQTIIAPAAAVSLSAAQTPFHATPHAAPAFPIFLRPGSNAVERSPPPCRSSSSHHSVHVRVRHHIPLHPTAPFVYSSPAGASALHRILGRALSSLPSFGGHPTLCKILLTDEVHTSLLFYG